ncbi:MAG TPA: DUF4349 domain-containing protein [Solirubrobacteraceae bacterium]|nr:DUF4349 domain-containing protein [Solirubrobacteraceae bacterium]
MPTDALDPRVQRELDAVDAALEGRAVDPDLTELGALALALREERPQPEPFFTRELDAKAAAGFPRPSRVKWLREQLRTSTLLLPGLATMLLALVVAAGVLVSQPRGGDDAAQPSGGLTSASSGEEAASGGGAVARSAPQNLESVTDEVGPAPSTIGPPGVPPPGGGGSPASDRRQARKQEQSASMTLIAPPRRLADLAGRVGTIATRHGGFVISSSLNTSEGGGGGEYLLRVPTRRLDTVLAELARLAQVREQRRETRDITAQHTSARRRLQDARAERRSLLRRLEGATTDQEAESLKAQLREVSRRIGIARTDLARADNRASFSNVAVSLFADASAGAAGDDGRWSPGDALRDAVRVLEVAAGVAVVALAVLLPLGLLVALAMLAARWAARRSRERALDAV